MKLFVTVFDNHTPEKGKPYTHVGRSFKTKRAATANALLYIKETHPTQRFAFDIGIATIETENVEPVIVAGKQVA